MAARSPGAPGFPKVEHQYPSQGLLEPQSQTLVIRVGPEVTHAQTGSPLPGNRGTQRRALGCLSSRPSPSPSCSAHSSTGPGNNSAGHPGRMSAFHGA